MFLSSFFIALCATASPPASLSLDKSPLFLGKTESVEVTFLVDEPPDAELRPLRVAVNVGTFSQVERLAAGRYRAVYVPPTTRFPQMALIAVWRETGAQAPIDFLKVPLLGSTKLKVGARPGAEVKVSVGELEFGPVPVTRGTQVDVPLSVAPGVTTATVFVKERSGSVATRSLPVDVPAYNRVTGALVPHALVADGHSEARLDIFYDLGGADVPASRVKVTPTVGRVDFVRAENGRYVYRFRPPAGTTASEVHFAISVEGDPASHATVTLQLGHPPPSRLVLRPPAGEVPADGTTRADVDVFVFDDSGLGLPNQPVTLSANDVALAAPRALGDGLYRFAFTAPAEYPAGGLVQFQARVGAVSTVAHFQLRAPPVPATLTPTLSMTPLPAGGQGERLSLEVRDAAGSPLEGAKLIALASHGTLGPMTRTAAGVYQLNYEPPAEASDEVRVKVVDATGAFNREFPLPMREHVSGLLFGLRGGYTHSLQALGGPRGGIDLSVPVRAGPTYLWLSLLAQGGYTEQTVTDETGALSSKSSLAFLPLTLRLAVELWASRRVSVLLGAGGGATLARSATTLTGREGFAVGPNAGGFAALHVAVGPGHFFVEAGYQWSPVQSADFRAETGGLGVSGGYRFGVW